MEVLLYDETGEALGRFRLCASRWSRLRGLMFRRRLLDDGLFFVFPPSRKAPWAVGIHMFFVFFPIAAIWLDEEGRIVHAVEARPFRVYAPPAPARYLVEGRPFLLARARVGARWAWEIRPGPAPRIGLSPPGFIRPAPSPAALLLMESALAEMEAELGRPPGIRDVLRARAMAGILDGFWDELAEILLDIVRGLDRIARGEVRSWLARQRPRHRIRAMRLAELAAERDAARILLEAAGDGVEAVPAWRGLFLYEDLAGAAWARWPDFRAVPCAACGRARKVRWMRAFPAAALRDHPGAWRLRRPEAHVPLCRTCEKLDPARRMDIARRIWGARFEALEAWARAAVRGDLPGGWNPRLHPLWPPAYGGRSWEEGDPSFPRGTAIRLPPGLEMPEMAYNRDEA
ncbi:MAG: DUF192 domain-containing protein [Armatimonadota bacterium]|nr:DUF192 domain-containing protein [Armatimonadota bacterium]